MDDYEARIAELERNVSALWAMMRENAVMVAGVAPQKFGPPNPLAGQLRVENISYQERTFDARKAALLEQKK